MQKRFELLCYNVIKKYESNAQGFEQITLPVWVMHLLDENLVGSVNVG